MKTADKKKAINKSHERSIAYGIKPGDSLPRIMLSESDIKNKRVKNKQLLEISTPFVNELMGMLDKELHPIIILTEKSGIILKVFGAEEDLKKGANVNLKKGTDMNEKSIGTNAIGTAIKESKAIQVNGTEHYIEAFKSWSCSASPIYDSNDAIIGTLTIAAEKEEFHPYTLALISSTARAIENRLHNSSIQLQLYNAQYYAFSIMNHLSFGLIAIDLKGKIHWVNDTACRSLNIKRSKLINIEVLNVYSNWTKLQETIDKGDNILDYEDELITNKTDTKYLLNAYSIKNLDDEKIGYALSFRPFSRMMKLVNKYSTPSLSFTFERIVYKSKSMKNLVEYAKTVANTPSTILITGESGTGKEVFAQSIHSASSRRNEPFIAINCGAISSSLIESELFGYEEGAFTGAVKGGKPGKFEMANKGTLFLDEIGEMPLEMQVKLLRVLQDKTVTRLGSGKSVKVDVRLIAATNKNLMEEVNNNKFRQDLFYRLSVIPLHIQPLRERKMDIPPLFQNFIKQKANKLDRPIPKIEQQLLKQLIQYDWPGNIRELENFAEKTVILDGNLKQLFPGTNIEETSTDNFDLNVSEDPENLPSLAHMEKVLIEKYLALFENNISQTAKKLGIGRNTLYQKMQKYKIEA